MNRTDWASNIAVLLLLVTGAVLLQDSIPPLLWGRIKPPFLLSVAVYYAVRRPTGLAILACVWTGILLDGLGTPQVLGPAIGLILLFLLFCVFWVRRQMFESMAACALFTALLAAILPLAQSFFQPWQESFSRIVFIVSSQAILQALLALPVSIVTVGIANAVDDFASNLPTEKDGDDFEWSGANR